MPLRGHNIGWAAGAAGFVAATVIVAAWVGRPASLALPKPGQAGEVQDLSISRIQEHIRRLSQAPSRMTGGAGADRAAQYIERQLRDLHLAEGDIDSREFETAAPVVEEAWLERAAENGVQRIDIHPLWPNLARTCQTPPGGIAGPLVDVGGGTDAELAGKRIRGSLVVMNWRTDTEWLSVPEFGGKAVIFRGAKPASGALARDKFLTVPAQIPRFYVEEKDLPALDRALSEPGENAVVHCSMAWKRVKGRNILARVSGREFSADDPRHAPIVFHAYYDSVSVTPNLAPGAEQACGAGALLELGRYMAALPTPPDHPVYLLFVSGHAQSMTGMARFVRDLHDGLLSGWKEGASGSLQARMGRPALFIGLDLSSRSDQLGVFCVGRLRSQIEGKLRPKFSVLGLKLAQYAADWTANPAPVERPSFVDCINLTLGRGWWTYFPYAAAFESEIPTLAGFPGITLATINDERPFVDTPDDRPDRMRFDLLEKQILARDGRHLGLSNLAAALANWSGPYVSSKLKDHLSRLSGRVVWLDQKKSFTPDEPLSGAMVFLKTQRGDKHLLGLRGIPAAITGADGAFEFDGLIDAVGNPYFLNPDNCMLEAYGAATRDFADANPDAIREYRAAQSKGAGLSPDPEMDGSILYAVDMARRDEYPWKKPLLAKEQSLGLVVFPCRSISLFGLTDPRGYIPLREPQILDTATRSPPFQFGQSLTDNSWGAPDENSVTLWAAPSARVALTLGFGFLKKRLILAANSAENPLGSGFALEELEGVPSMALQGARDMWNLDEWRMRKLEAQGIGNPRVRKSHLESGRSLEAAEAALKSLDYKTYRIESEQAWALEGRSYGELLSLTNNMIRGVLFYLALLLPFAYCLERLLFASRTIRNRILCMTSIFIVSFLVLALVHPAFRFTLTPLLVLLAFLILALAVTVSALIFGKFDLMLRDRKQESGGLHEDTLKRGEIAVRAIDLGIANIRRRPQRGFLTGMTVILITFTLLSFISIVPDTSISRLKHPDGLPVYRGLLARDRGWNPLPGSLYDSLRRRYSPEESREAAAERRSIVAGRAWFFSDRLGNLSQVDIAASGRAAGPVGPAAAPASAETASSAFTAVSLLCMEPGESSVTGVDRTLIAGHWFRDEEELGAILPASHAAQIGLGADDLGRSVQIFGEELPLIGIFDEGKFDELADIDGEPLTPVDFVSQSRINARKLVDPREADTLEKYIHYSSGRIAIIPLRFGLRLGASFRSAAVVTGAGADPVDEAAGYARRSNQTILASDGGAVTLFSARDTSSFSTAGQIGVPLLLGFIMTLGTMLGSVYERRREIFVYNSVGLSPTDVSSLFLAESSVYAIVGACAGYLAGQVVSRILQQAGALSGLSLNYSAGAAVFVAVLTMTLVLVSTLYPARQAFLAAIPESRKKEGAGEKEFASDSIQFYLPFVANPDAILGMQAYLYEHLHSFQGVAVGTLGVENLEARMEIEGGSPAPTLSFRAWLAPFDLGISHDARVSVVYRGDRGIYQYRVGAIRFSGDQQNWRRLTPRFIAAVRKQLLMWRILSDAAHRRYAEEGERLFGRRVQEGSGGTDRG